MSNSDEIFAFRFVRILDELRQRLQEVCTDGADTVEEVLSEESEPHQLSVDNTREDPTSLDVTQ